MRLAILILLALLSHLSAAEHRLGWKSNPRHSKGLKQMVPMRAVPLPPRASLLSLMPPAYDQGDIGSCVANSGALIHRVQWKAQHGEFLNPSRLDLYQNCLRKDGSFPRDNGTYTSSVLWVLQNQGVGLERCWPYRPEKLAQNAPKCVETTRGRYSAIIAYDVPLASVRECIAIRKLPVIFGGYVYNDIFNVTKSNPYIPMPRGSPVGGHEMTIIAYDDDMWKDWNGNGRIDKGEKGFAQIQNSWGDKTWGDAGRAWMPYDYALNPKYCEDYGTIERTK